MIDFENIQVPVLMAFMLVCPEINFTCWTIEVGDNCVSIGQGSNNTLSSHFALCMIE